MGSNLRHGKQILSGSKTFENIKPVKHNYKKGIEEVAKYSSRPEYLLRGLQYFYFAMNKPKETTDQIDILLSISSAILGLGYIRGDQYTNDARAESSLNLYGQILCKI